MLTHGLDEFAVIGPADDETFRQRHEQDTQWPINQVIDRAQNIEPAAAKAVDDADTEAHHADNREHDGPGPLGLAVADGGQAGFDDTEG